MKAAVIGGGIVGLATALELRRLQPALEIRVFEKEPAVGRHQSTHNSGVLHAGTYYKPGSLKAVLAVRGLRRMVEFCQIHGIAHEICGKLIVATNPEQAAVLELLFLNAQANGLRDVKKLAAEEIREYEPHASGVAALHVPEEGIVDYDAVCRKMALLLEAQGVGIAASAEVAGVEKDGHMWKIRGKGFACRVDRLINCGGLHSDRLCRMAGGHSASRIVPFRGEYYQLKATARHLVRHLIYPAPDVRFPFLGVHFTRLVKGGVEAGPNAVLALAREGYRKGSFNIKDSAETLAFPGLWRFLARYPRASWEELSRSFSKRLFCRSLQALVPALRESDLEAGGSGVRAQAMTFQGQLVQDFDLAESEGALHVLNAPSPAATASLAIGEYIARKFMKLPG